MGLTALGSWPRLPWRRSCPSLTPCPPRKATAFVASGLVEGDVRFTSVQAKTLFARCACAFKPFSEKESKAIASARNDYLHAAAPTSPRYPGCLVASLLGASPHSRQRVRPRPEDLVGSDRVAPLRATLTKNKQNIEHRREMLIERARQRLGLYQSGQMRATSSSSGLIPGRRSPPDSHSGSTEVSRFGADGKL